MNRLFNYIFQADVKRLDKFLRKFLIRYYGEQNVSWSAGHFIVARGKIPMMVVAHMDTVHRESNQGVMYYDPKHRVAWSPAGLGADDRAGIYSIVALILKGYRPSIAFTHDEECGGKGAKVLSKVKIKDYGIKVNFIIELDRAGQNHAVYYDCENTEFKTMIKTFIPKEETGSYSDIVDLSKGWDVASANLAIGYYNAHQKTEMLYIDIMEHTMSKVEQIMIWAKKNPKISFDHQARKVKTWVYDSKGYGSYGKGGYEYDDYDDYFSKNLGQNSSPIHNPDAGWYRSALCYEWDEKRLYWFYKANADKTKNPVKVEASTTIKQAEEKTALIMDELDNQIKNATEEIEKKNT